MIFQDNILLEASSEAKLYSSKLKNMRLHLQELLQKKLRLELEIKNLKRSIDKKTQDYERNLKAKLTLESDQFIDESLAREIYEGYPEVYDALWALEREFKLFESLVEEYNLEKSK